MTRLEKVLGFLFLGRVVFDCNGALWSLFLAWWSARVAPRLHLGGRHLGWLRRTVGGLFIALCIKLALSRQG